MYILQEVVAVTEELLHTQLVELVVAVKVLGVQVLLRQMQELLTQLEVVVVEMEQVHYLEQVVLE